MNKTLVVFHSRSGNTRRVAQMLTTRLKADTDEIAPLLPHDDSRIGYALCSLEAVAALTPAIAPPAKDPSRYSLVVIGTPIWFWSVSSPVRTWLVQQQAALAKSRVAFFCTMGGSGAPIAFARMGVLADHEPVATLALTQAQVKHGATRAIDNFVNALQPAPRKARR
jgi:menaquinone-dependent protoporphyrinogen IX oxidase